MKRLILLTLLSSCFTSQAQSYEWGINTGPAGNQAWARATAMDASGNVWTVGSFQGTMDLDPFVAASVMVSSMGGDDIFVQKLSPSGTFLQGFSIGGAFQDVAHDIAIDGSGNIYITGEHAGGGDFDPGPGTTTLATAGSADVFIAKYDASGNMQWAKSAGGSSVENSKSIDVDDSGTNVVITGNFGGSGDFNPDAGVTTLTSNGFQDGYIMLLNGSGVFQWVHQYGGTGDDYLRAVTLEGSTHVIATGLFQNTVDFDPSITSTFLTSWGGADIVVFRFPIGGTTPDFAFGMGGTGWDEGMTIQSTSSGNIVVGGRISSVNIDMDPGAGSTLVSCSSAPFDDCFIASYSNTGAFQWAKSFGSSGNDQLTNLAVAADGNIYTTGVFYGSTDFDPGPGTATIAGAGGWDAFMQKLDASGNYLNAFYLGGSTDDYGTSVATGPASRVIFAGHFAGPCDFNPGTSPSDDFHTPVGLQDIYITSFSACVPTSETINAAVCDTFWLNGTSYTSTGTYTQVIPNAAGCDSTITLNLDILTTYSPPLGGTFCFSHTVNGTTYTSSGTYYQTLTNAAGCDSILTINVMIDTVNTGVNATPDSLIVMESVSNILAIYWIDCSTGAAVPASGNPWLIPSDPGGSYAAVITTTDGCTDTTDCAMLLNHVGGNLAADITLSPNPSTGVFRISLPAGRQHAFTCEVWTPDGRMILNHSASGNTELDLGNQSAGIYLIKISTGDQVITRKLILQ